MSRKFMAIFVASTMAFGSVSTNVWSASEATPREQTQAGSRVENESPLPAGGPAGIKQAQGLVDVPFLTIGLGLGALALLWILMDEDDDDNSVPTTGT